VPTFALRVDGNRHIGMGHVFRAMFLAEHLRAAGAGAEVLALGATLVPPVTDFLAARGLRTVPVSGPGDPWRADPQQLRAAYASGRYAGAVVDLLEPDPGDDDLLDNPQYVPADLDAELDAARGAGLPLCVFSDRCGPMDFQAAVLVNTCPAQRRQWYQASAARVLLGPEGYILAPSFAALAARGKAFTREVPRVVVFCGGNDHRGFTGPILDGIAASGLRAEVEVVLGAATPDAAQREREYAARVARVHRGAPDLAEILGGADFVFSTSGNTLFDLAALGVPCAAVSTRERQQVTARFFAACGSCLDLGRDRDALPGAVAAVCAAVLPDRARLAAMSRAGRRAVDGAGGGRVARAVLAMAGEGAP